MRPVLSVVAVVHTTDTLGPFVGSIQPRYKTDLGFRIFGRMVARFVDVGATVTKGQEIAALDPAVQALAVRSAEASLANAEAQFANAQAEEARQKDLVQRSITPQAQYDLTRRNLETTTANLTRARASLRKAKDALGYTRLDADFDGVITNRYAEPGQVLTAGQKVVTLARPEVREAVIAVPDKLAEQLSHAKRLHHHGRPRHACRSRPPACARIDPIADPNTRTRNVYLTLNDPPAAFRLGATVSVTFTPPGRRARRPAGHGAAREGRQDLRLGGRSGQEARCRNARSPSARARATASSSPPASRRASASSSPACTALRPASGSARRRRNEWLQSFRVGARHRSFTWYLILALTLAGGIAYTRLGREEDPAFAIKTMVVQTSWPGATIDDTIDLVTDPIEKKLEEVDYLDYVKSYTKPGSRSSTST